jgi:hypothetical protein
MPTRVLNPRVDRALRWVQYSRPLIERQGGPAIDAPEGRRACMGQMWKGISMKHVTAVSRPAPASSGCTVVFTVSLGTARIIFTSAGGKGDFFVNFGTADEFEFDIDIESTC